MAKVSVIIPVYNTEKFLKQCLDSVCSQTLQDIEIICINDCSTDNSWNIVQKYAANDGRFKLISFSENKGAATARNIGLDFASGEYIGFVDSDDFIDTDFYERLYTEAVKQNAEVVRGNALEVRDNQNFYCYENLLEEIIKSKSCFNGLFVTAIYKKSLIDKHKILFLDGYDYGEDRLFPLMATMNASKFFVIKNTYYNYVRHNDSASSTCFFNGKKVDDYIKTSEILLDYVLSLNIDDDALNLVNSFIVQTFDIIKNSCSEKKLFEFLKKLFVLKEEKEKYFTELKKDLNNALEEENIDKIEVEYEIINKKMNNKKLLGSLRKNIKKQNEVIPKKVFYIWLGGNKPNLVNICIENWRYKLPGFELIEINENSPYFDFESALRECKWFKTVYERKMWAYVSDYIRCMVLYNHGGIYLDTDMTIYKDISPLLSNTLFLGWEQPDIISAGIIGAKKNHPFFKDMINFYQNEIFTSSLYVITHIFTNLIKKNNYDDMKIYSKEYFYPFYGNEIFTRDCITENTYAVHWWHSSWRSEEEEYFLENKHKIPLDDIDNSFIRHNRLKSIIMKNKKG